MINIAAAQGEIFAMILIGGFILFFTIVASISVVVDHKVRIKKLENEALKIKQKNISEWDRKHFDGSHESW